jgi:gluconate 2-dehydrogenase gamma chain
VSDTPTGSVRSRRDFIALLGTTAGSAWLATIWHPAIADASEAANAAQQGQAPRYRALTSQQADDFGAAADRIIPRDDAPGARDVGVVFFADHLLASFAPAKKPAFDAALRALNAAARKRVPSATSFATLTPQQQDETLQSIETTDDFNVLRTVTVAGYFSHPSHRGNRDAAGWKAIGFEDRMSWTPPFGYYDRPEVMARLLPGRRT